MNCVLLKFLHGSQKETRRKERHNTITIDVTTFDILTWELIIFTKGNSKKRIIGRCRPLRHNAIISVYEMSFLVQIQFLISLIQTSLIGSSVLRVGHDLGQARKPTKPIRQSTRQRPPEIHCKVRTYFISMLSFAASI